MLAELLSKVNHMSEFMQAQARKTEGEEHLYFLQTNILLQELRCRLVREMFQEARKDG